MFAVIYFLHVQRLGLVLGQILYISAVNDEVSQWKKPENGADSSKSSPTATAAPSTRPATAFVLAMVSAVAQLTQYLNAQAGKAERRDSETMLNIMIPHGDIVLDDQSLVRKKMGSLVENNKADDD